MIPEGAMLNMRRVAATGLLDTCTRMVHTEGSGDYGHGAPTYPAGVTMACLFKPRPEDDAGDGVRMVDADLWLARDAVLLPDDRVKITHLHGDAVASPQTFAVTGGPVLGKTLLHAELRLVTDGS